MGAAEKKAEPEDHGANSFDKKMKEMGFGWFDFNDCSVTPISVSRLASQYAGKSECACNR